MRKFLNMHDEYDKLTTLFAFSYHSSFCSASTRMNESLFFYLKRIIDEQKHGLSELYVNDNDGVGCGAVICHICILFIKRYNTNEKLHP